MTEPAGGLQFIREAVAARKPLMVTLAREAGISIDLLDSFAQGRADLPLDRVQALVAEIWQYVEYNAELDKLQATAQPPARSVGVLPKLEMTLPKYTPGANQRGGPTREIPVPKPKPRPGWR